MILLVFLGLGWNFVLTVAAFMVMAAERGKAVKLDARQVSLIVRETCCRALIVLATPFGFSEPLPPIDADASKPPVLLIPGFRQSYVSLLCLKTFLRRRGWRACWAVNTSKHDHKLAEHAADLGRKIKHLLRATGAEQVALVGHGMGGLIAAWYARHHDEEELVQQVITIGTAWRGTKMAIFGGGQARAEMLPSNAQLTDLVTTTTVSTSIWSTDDPWVIPSESATPDGIHTVGVESAGHFEMLFSARVYRATLTALMTSFNSNDEASV